MATGEEMDEMATGEEAVGLVVDDSSQFDAISHLPQYVFLLALSFPS